MQRKLIFILILMVLIAVFALQNSEEARIQLWFWSVSTSMALVLILTFAAGAIAGILFSIPDKSRKANRDAARSAESGFHSTPPGTRAGASGTGAGSPGLQTDLTEKGNTSYTAGAEGKTGDREKNSPPDDEFEDILR